VRVKISDVELRKAENEARLAATGKILQRLQPKCNTAWTEWDTLTSELKKKTAELEAAEDELVIAIERDTLAATGRRVRMGEMTDGEREELARREKADAEEAESHRHADPRHGEGVL
jgi:hypothetical protein